MINSRIMVIRLILLIVSVVFLAGCGKNSQSLVSSPEDCRQRIAAGKSKEVLECLRHHLQATTGQTVATLSDEWVHVWVSAALVERAFPDLVQLYQLYPDLVSSNEEAAYYLARLFAHSGEIGLVSELEAFWKSGSSHPEWWAFIRADQIRREEGYEAAVLYLDALHFDDTRAEAERLLRLALMTTREPKRAKHYLDQAYQADPRYPDVRLVRAGLLESAGKLELARFEYVAAVVAEPEYVLARRELADFYLRHGVYAMAYRTLTEFPQGRIPGALSLRAVFITRITGESTTGANMIEVEKEWKALFDALSALPERTFFDEESLRPLLSANIEARDREELLWLRVIQSLVVGDEESARTLLGSRMVTSIQWEPDLWASLKILTNYRLDEMSPSPDDLPVLSNPDNRHSFFDEIFAWAQQSKLNPEPEGLLLKSMVSGMEVYAAAFFAAGWNTAGLALAAETSSGEYPPEYDYMVGRAMLLNDGAQKAGVYLKSARSTPLVTLLRGEVALAAGQEPLARQWLMEASRSPDSEVAYRAAWLLGELAAGRGEWDQVELLCAQVPVFGISPRGVLLRARRLQAMGKLSQAEKMLDGISGELMEAKVLLSQLAYARNDLKGAQRWTEALIETEADQPVFRSNWQQIQQANAQ